MLSTCISLIEQGVHPESLVVCNIDSSSSSSFCAHRIESHMFCRFANAPLQQVIKELREIADETRREQQEAAVANSRR